MADEPEPHKARTSPLLTAGLIAAATLGAVALASRRSGIFGSLSDGTAPFGRVAGRAAIGALVGVLLAVGVVSLLRLTNTRHRLIEDAPTRPRWSRVLAWCVPLVLLMAVLGAAAGSATTPLQPRAPEEIDELPRSGGSGESGGSTKPCATAHRVDLDGDGQPDLDENGDEILVLDADCDGKPDRRLVPCSGSSATYNGPTRHPHAAPAIDNAPIDQNCDGKIERIIELSPRIITSLEPTDTGNGDNGTRSQPNSPDFPDALRSLGIIVAIVLAIALLYGLFVLLTRGRGRDTDPSDPEPATSEEEVADGVDREAAAATLDDSLAALLADPDPRTAIRAAYATLLDGLAAAGIPRAPYEAPEEHLTRCLRSLQVRPEPMRDLVDVFVLARFSDHEVTEAHRSSALDALRGAQADLADATVGAGNA